MNIVIEGFFFGYWGNEISKHTKKNGGKSKNTSIRSDWYVLRPSIAISFFKN